MKEFREFSNILIGFLLFVFIFAFTLGLSIKGIIQNDLLTEPIKEHVVTSLIDADNQEIKELSAIFEDDDIKDMMHLIIDNYQEYSLSDNYQLSEKDALKFKEIVIKYKDKILSTYSEETRANAEQEINTSLTYNVLNENTKSLFYIVDSSVNEVGMKNLVNLYFRVTSGKTYFILMLCILGLIGLLLLVNWSLVKWAKIAGIGLTVTGGIIVFGYILVSIIKMFLVKASSGEEVSELISSVSFTGLLVRGIITLVLGITLLVLYHIYKDKKFFAKKENKVLETQPNLNQTNEQQPVIVAEQPKEEQKNDEIL